MLPAPSDLTRWREDIYRAFGYPNPKGRVSWLEAMWHGEPDVCRVVLYQVVPQGATSSLYLGEDQRYAAYKGQRIPDPRFKLHVNPAVLLLRPADELYRRYNCYAQPFWVVQGEKGGHKRRFTSVETRLLQTLGHSGKPPIPGDLPFAPVDRRVIEALAPLDSMNKWSLAIDFAERNPDHFEAEEKAAIQDGQKQVTAWLMDQVGAAIDSEVTYKRTWDLPRIGGSEPDYDRLAEEIHASV